MQKLTTTIKREWLQQIVAGEKQVEYREIKPYWTRRLDGIQCPFLLRLINGMVGNAPEVTVRIDRIQENRRTGNYELHIGRVVEIRHWDKRRASPVP